ncbi:putative DNA-binding protein, partial [Salmonella enterica subsp. enterica serovar Paratyphi B str. SARA56]
MARPKTHSERMIILERIIGLVKEQGRITTNDVVAMFGVHRTTAEKYLQIALVRGGFIRHGRCGVFRDQRAVIDYDL